MESTLLKKFLLNYDDEVREQAEVNIKYRGYIEKKKKM
jgi:tRNA uridine 5-carboxymethylaminomethyl modification enzyme